MLDYSRRAALFCVLFISLFPGTIFFSALYSESVFLFLALAVVYCSRKGWWWPLLPLGFLAALARPVGLVLLLPAAWEYLRARRFRPGPGLAWLTGFPAGIAAWMAYCSEIFGDSLAFAARQTAWRGTFSGPWKAFTRFFVDPAFDGSHISVIDFSVAALALAGCVYLFRKVRFSYGLLAAAMVFLPLCTSLWSFTRLSAVVFPLFIGLALVAEKRPRVRLFYVAAAPLLAGLFMVLFASWGWAG